MMLLKPLWRPLADLLNPANTFLALLGGQRRGRKADKDAASSLLI
jgi:hypothetical protein